MVRESLDFLPMIQYILFSINPNCLRLMWICGFQVSRRSKCIPRYLTDVSCGMSFPLRETAGHPSLRYFITRSIISPTDTPQLDNTGRCFVRNTRDENFPLKWMFGTSEMNVWDKSPCCSERDLFNLRPAHVQWIRDCKLLNKRWIIIALPPRSVNVNWRHTAAAHLISCNNNKFNLYENIVLRN